MIRTFRHRGLKRLFRDGDGIRRADQLARINDVLAHLDKGELRGYWSTTISGNWRIVFRFADGDCFDIDLVDYH